MNESKANATSTASTASAYAKRFKRVFDYIDLHLNEELTVEHLSDIAHFSKFHFHRQFSQYCGINVIRYVQLMRLKRASYRLAFNSVERIIDIALDAGFENPESFSRAFKQTFGQTPSEFRQAPEWISWNAHYQFPLHKRIKNMKEHFNVNVITTPNTMVAVLEHRGNPALINNTAARFIEWRKTTGLSPVASSQTFGIGYDDPEITPAAEFRFDVCGSVDAPVPENPQGVITKHIPGGRCAVVRHLGSHDKFGEIVYYLYQQWLPESGEELRDFPVYFLYHNLTFDTPEHELLTDIYLPLK